MSAVRPSSPSEVAGHSTNNEPKVSPLFTDNDADLAFVSADDVVFRIYSKHLETTSAGLAPPASTIIDPLETILLTEPATVLEVLFSFIHPRSESEQYHQPSVVGMKIPLFFEVAEAAEKYLVYGAMNTCVTYMHQIYSSCPAEVLNHCANHGYNSLADKAAILTISLSNPIEKTLTSLKDPGIALKWTKYYGHWLQIPKLAGDLWLQEETLESSSKCQRRAAMISVFLRNVTANLACGVGSAYTSAACSYTYSFGSPGGGCDCHSESSPWKIKINTKIRAIPKFSVIT